MSGLVSAHCSLALRHRPASEAKMLQLQQGSKSSARQLSTSHEIRALRKTCWQSLASNHHAKASIHSNSFQTCYVDVFLACGLCSISLFQMVKITAPPPNTLVGGVPDNTLKGTSATQDGDMFCGRPGFVPQNEAQRSVASSMLHWYLFQIGRDICL